jgi:hypothetical protein
MNKLDNVMPILQYIKSKSVTDTLVKTKCECDVGHLSEDDIAMLEYLGYEIKVCESEYEWDDSDQFHTVCWRKLGAPHHEQIELDANNYTIHYKWNPDGPFIEDNHFVATFQQTTDKKVIERCMKDDSSDCINKNSVFGIEKLRNFSGDEIKEILVSRINSLSVSDLHKIIELAPGLSMNCYHSILNPDETISLVDCKLDVPTSEYIFKK